MAGLLQSLLTFILLYKYAAIFVLTFLASLAIPIPSGAITAASFFFATQGYMNAPLIALASAAGNILGDLLTFRLTRRYGGRLVRRFGFVRVRNSAIVQKIEAKISEHPVSTVFVSRLTTSITPLVNVLAGFSKMSFRVFAAAAVVGEITETAVCFVYGTFFGNELAYIAQVTGLAGMIFLLCVALIGVAFWRRRRARRAAA